MNTGTGYRIKKMSLQLLVTDIDHSIKFYTQCLGFDLDFRYEDFYAGIIKEDCSIHLKMIKPSIDQTGCKQNNEDIDIIFSVDAIDQLYHELSNRTVEITQPLRHMPYGKEFYIADPDHHIIAFLQEA